MIGSRRARSAGRQRPHPAEGRPCPPYFGFDMYKWRHLVENFFCNLKQFRRIATRYEKTGESFAAMIHLAGTRFALK
jgi:transposase